MTALLIFKIVTVEQKVEYKIRLNLVTYLERGANCTCIRFTVYLCFLDNEPLRLLCWWIFILCVGSWISILLLKGDHYIQLERQLRYFAILKGTMKDPYLSHISVINSSKISYFDNISVFKSSIFAYSVSKPLWVPW